MMTWMRIVECGGDDDDDDRRRSSFGWGGKTTVEV